MIEKLANISTPQKADLLDILIEVEYEALIRIDTFDELAMTLYASDCVWERTKGISFPFEETVKHYILDISVDTDPELILEELSLSKIMDNVHYKGKHVVFYTIHDSKWGLGIKKATFFPADEGIIMMAVKDISTGFNTISRNIEQLRHSLTEAQAEISEKENFLSLMDQHIRAPLYSIMGLTRIAQEQVSPYVFDDYLHKISLSGSYMKETIDDILSLRQIARRDIVPKPMIVSLDDFFSNIERLIHPNITEKGLLFEMDTSNIRSLHIVTDPRCLQQVILKMLQSAVSYTVKGGRIRLHAHIQHYTDNNVDIEFSVENRGIVIDKERLEILFKPYDYLRNRLNRSIGDLDLALLILRSNLMALGSNSITAESDEQKGTRISVTISFPLSENSGQDVLKREPIPDFHGKRVLLVDDNDISLEVSEKLLFNKGIEVVKAHNGKEALDIFISEGGSFDLILMDILMPVMDGLQATGAIRALPDIPNAKTIPIIALTVNAFKEHFEESLRAGMNTHLVKPIEPESLYKVLLEYLT